MKKILVFLMLFLLCSCQKDISIKEDTSKTYNDMIELIKNQDKFLNVSDYFNTETEITKIEGGYRFYVVVDKPKIAMYDIEALAIEKDVDYTNQMAASIGIFEEEQYNMIPNQANVDKGYVKGVVISGTTDKKDMTVYMLVSWKNKDLSITNNQFIQLHLRYNEDHVDSGALNG